MKHIKTLSLPKSAWSKQSVVGFDEVLLALIDFVVVLLESGGDFLVTWMSYKNQSEETDS